MRCLRWWLAMPLFVTALMVFGASAALRLPSLTAGGHSYSNVTVSVSTGGRILVEYATGMATVKISELDLDTQQQLVGAGLIGGEAAKEIEKQIAKRDAAKKKAEAGSGEAIPVTEQLGDSSFAGIVTRRVAQEANQQNVEFSLNGLTGRFGQMLVGGIALLLVFSGIVRRFLFYRICKNATGRGSFLVFIPGLRWIALVEAARMSKQWLLVPIFALTALLLPPPFAQKFGWATTAFLIFLAVLWLAALFFYVVWCMRLCLTLDRSVVWALFLMFPLIDFIPLFILAYSEPKTDASPGLGIGDPIKSPVLAI